MTTPIRRGKRGRGRFRFGSKKTLGLQPALERLEGLLAGAGPGKRHRRGNQLQLTSGLVERQAAPDLHLVAVFRPEVQPLHLPGPHDAAKLGPAILQRKVAVATLPVPSKIREFAFDDQFVIERFDRLAERLGQFADPPDPWLEGKIK